MRNSGLVGWVLWASAVALSGCSGRVTDTGSPGGAANTGGASSGGSTVGSGGRSGSGGTASGGTASGGFGTGGSPEDAGSPPSRDASATDAGPPLCSYPGDAGIPASVATVSMGTFCGTLQDCTRGIVDLLDGRACEPGDPLPLTGAFSLTVGCGVRTLHWGNSYAEDVRSYSFSTNELVYGRFASDVNQPPCNAFAHQAGTFVDCPTALHYTCDSALTAPDAGSHVCCRPDVLAGACQTESDVGNVTFAKGPCDPACAPCPACTDQLKNLLLSLPDRPECHCPAVPPDGDVCFGPTTCDCWCQTLSNYQRACPGVR